MEEIGEKLAECRSEWKEFYLVLLLFIGEKLAECTSERMETLRETKVWMV